MAEAPHGAGLVVINYKIYKNQRLVGGRASFILRLVSVVFTVFCILVNIKLPRFLPRQSNQYLNSLTTSDTDNIN